MVKKMREFQTLRGGKAEGYNPKLTAARAKLAQVESEIEKLIDTLTGATPLLLQYANSRIEELDVERQKQLSVLIAAPFFRSSSVPRHSMHEMCATNVQ